MNKSELVQEFAQETGMHPGAAEYVINEIFTAMTESLVKGDGIEIRGFGSFVVREYAPYKGRNPKSGTSIQVQEKKLPFFKVGKELKERVVNFNVKKK